MTEHLPNRGPSPWLALAAVVGGVVLIWLGIAAVASSMFGAGYTMGGHVVRAVATLPLVLGLLWLVLRWQRASAARFGLAPDRRTPREGALGALAYLAPFTAAAVVIVGLGLASLSVVGSLADVLRELLIVLVLVLLYEAIPEELVFRGYLFASLAERWPPWAAVVGQAVLFCLFGAAVGAARSPDRLLLFLLFSLSVGVTRQVTGSVFATIGFHAVFQLVTQSVLGDQWSALSVSDPDRWFTDLAFGLVPMACGPVMALLAVRSLGWRRVVGVPTAGR